MSKMKKGGANALTVNPERQVILSFLGVIVAGAVLLKLPLCARNPGLSWVDAVFMSTSAVCVTGLSVIDIGTDLTFSGQVIILFLMQLGGLGIMTFSLFLSLFFHLSTTLTSRLSIAAMFNKMDVRSLRWVLLRVFILTLLIESVGACLFYLRFKDIHPLPRAVFSSVFHAISAFCNCGLSLYRDSLSRFQMELLVPFTTMMMIVLGGLGFVVMIESLQWVKARARHRHKILSLHTKICLTTSFILLAGGSAAIWFLERRDLMADMPLVNQWVNALFLSVSSRTAGFNTVDTGLLSNATLFFLIMLMFIGGCPGSTAGGIKTSTFAVLAAYLKGILEGSEVTLLFRRKIPSSIIDKSMMVFFVAVLLLGLATIFLQMTEDIPALKASGQDGFLALFFEVTSASGTVGLSTGVTPKLSFLGKWIIILLMFLGRVGPLTLGMVLFRRQKPKARFEFVEENVMIG
jgi:trk system potassium uptake protein TrkH